MKNPLACLVMAVVISACTLEPDDVYVRHIEEPNPTGFISLNSFDDQDTIYLFKGADFLYDLGIDQGRIDGVRILLGKSSVYSGREASGKFTLNSYDLRTGTYELKIEFVVDPQTGSLANTIGAENYQLYRTWIVVVDVDPPPTPVLNLSKENGFLKLSWNPYSKPNFVSYEIEIEYDYNSSRYVVIKNADQSFWIDSSYVGGYAAKYRVRTNAMSSRSSEYKFIFDSQVLKTSYRASDSTVSLTWRKCPYAGAFKNYQVMANGEEKLIANVNDTTFSYSLNEVVFQKEAHGSFNVKPRYPQFSPFSLTFTISNTAGALTLPRFTSVKNYNGVIAKFTGIRNGYFLYLDDQLKKTDSIPMTSNDPLGNFASPYVYYGRQGSVHQLNLVTKQEKKSPVRAGHVSGPTDLSAAANGLASYRVITRVGNLYANLILYDFTSETFIEEKKSLIISTSNVPSPFYVSGHGQYLFSYFDEKVYRMNGSTYDLVGTLPTTGNFYRFREDNNEHILMHSFNSLILVNASDLSVVTTVTAPAGNNFISYDPATRFALFAKSNSERIYLINIDTQATKVVKAKTGSLIDYQFINGYLFAANGSYLKVL